MASEVDSRRDESPKGILKKPSQREKITPRSPVRQRSASSKEITIENTRINAGPRESALPGLLPGSRRHSSRATSVHAQDDPESSQRLKWDEANLYLAELDRTSTMKINEPKTPYAKHYDPVEDPSDDEAIMGGTQAGFDGPHERKVNASSHEDDIPGLSLGEPEEAIPESTTKTPRKEKTVHVDDAGSHHGDDEMIGLSAEEREKHRRFEQMRKQHYQMKEVAQLLGHPEAVPEDDNNDESMLPVSSALAGSVPERLAPGPFDDLTM